MRTNKLFNNKKFTKKTDDDVHTELLEKKDIASKRIALFDISEIDEMLQTR